MPETAAFDPALTISLALVAGLCAQILAAHLGVPGIVVLLLSGVLLGPEVANVVRPDSLGSSMSLLVGFAVAIILFEGGLNLDLRRLRREQKVIRRLVSVGALLTAAGGALAARWILGWPWQRSMLFGTLVIVTGPTVVTPLLRRIKLQRAPATVLEAEGILIDAIGAIIAAVALDVVLSPAQTLVSGLTEVATRLAFGALVGAIGGLLAAGIVSIRRLIPPGFANVLILSFALIIFQTANAVFDESGIAAVTVAGIVVGNSHTRIHRELAEFKEQLTLLFLGMLFILLAADVHLASVRELGWPGVLTVACLLFVVRPVNVAVATFGSSLTFRQRLFVAWIAPRGIVAAAVASLFAVKLERAGIGGARSLRALVFLVIASTVIWSGVTGPWMAKLLGVRKKSSSGWLLLAAHAFARTTARVLRECDEPVLCIDSDPVHIGAAEADGLRALHANALEERTLQRAEIDTRAGVVGVSTNEESNVIFGQTVRRLARDLPCYVAIDHWTQGITPGIVEHEGLRVAFGGAIDIELWNRRIEEGEAILAWWRCTSSRDADSIAHRGELNAPHVVLVHRRGTTARPFSLGIHLRRGDEVAVLIDRHREAEVISRMHAAGWAKVGDSSPAPSSTLRRRGLRRSPA
ncbi:MAG: sodium:proton antiporter [Polyangiales bacterium]|nr:sodium:proton antiporter [Myxococcales bacterium]